MELRFGERTWLMGVINLTPDSFSGDGLAPRGATPEQVVATAVEQGERFVAAGAQLLDVGGESTRPRQFYGERREIDAAAELAMVEPVVAALAARFGAEALVSIDTQKGSIARACLAAGAGMVNDVWAGRHDPDTARAAAEAGAYLVLMHNQEVAEYAGDVVDEVIRWLGEAVEAALEAGVPRELLLVDPGIGFGKTGEHNLEILHRLAEVKAALGLPLMIGTSRKRFIGRLLDDAPPDDRVEAALEAGVPRELLLVDPGIGFGKTGEHNLEILHRLAEVKAALGLPLMIGTSRKRFIGRLLDDAPPDDRVEGTAATVALAIAAGADMVRVHDVAHIARTIRVADAIVRR